LALALGLALGLRKGSSIPDPINAKNLISNKCPNYSRLAADGKEVTIEAVLRAIMKIGATEQTNFALEYGAPGSYEVITMIVDSATANWLRANSPSGSVVRVKGIKTDCSIRVAYDAGNDVSSK
jgi:hypothetical protein